MQLPAPETSQQEAAPRIPTGTGLALDIPRGPATPFHVELAATSANAPAAPKARPRRGHGIGALGAVGSGNAFSSPRVLERVRLTPETRKDLEERWSKRMAAEPTLKETFLVSLARHLTVGGR